MTTAAKAYQRHTKKARAQKRRLTFASIVTGVLLAAAWGVTLSAQQAPPEHVPGPIPIQNARFAAQEEEKTLIDAPFIDQREEFPTGCESVTAVMALQYAGVDIQPGDFIDNYLPLGNAPLADENGDYWGCDPNLAFPGDPRLDSGWGCYAPVIVKAINEAADGKVQATELHDVPLTDLCETYIDKGVPVLLWVTIDMAEPKEGMSWLLEGSGERFTWVYPMHCALLTGYDKESYYFNDPMVGKNTAYPKENVEAAYAGLGKQAVVLE